jgi:hypothetical protein
MTHGWSASVAAVSAPWRGVLTGLRGLSARLASVDGSLRFLRITWMLWLGSFLVLYALPVIVLVLPEPRGRSYLLAEDGRIIGALLTGTEWGWDAELWLPALLAVVVPAVLHVLLARRARSPFFLARSVGAATHDYRSCQPWGIETSVRAARRLGGLYAGRMGLAMGLGWVTYLALYQTTFHVRGMSCFPVAERSIAEYLFYVSILFGAAMVHVPITRRVLGAPPRITHPRG